MARREPTEEQKRAAAERRAAMRRLAKQIGDMTDSQRSELAARVVGIATIEGRALSLHNMCMVAMQNPTATIVGGFRQWLNAGRAVRKGEHGMCIWIPCWSGKDDSGDVEGSPDRFILATVFDVSQTEAVEAEVAA